MPNLLVKSPKTPISIGLLAAGIDHVSFRNHALRPKRKFTLLFLGLGSYSLRARVCEPGNKD